MSKISSNLIGASPPDAREGTAGAGWETGLPWGMLWLILLVIALCGTGIVRLLHPAQAVGLFVPVVALLICLLAVGFDAAITRIPNALTYTGILLGLGFNSLASLVVHFGASGFSHALGTVGAGQAFLGFSLTAGIGLICLMFDGMGGGDVKLMVAMGALLGFSQVSLVLLWTLLVAMPFAIVNLIARGRLNGLLRAGALQILQILYLRRLDPVEPPSQTFIPLAVPMLIAFICVHIVPRQWLWQWIGGG
jgi:Flp pilus assembly protein protease CpaA